MNLSIDFSRSTGSLAPFWCSTGFTPATLLLTDDMRQTLAYLGSIPRRGIRYNRIHFLLELAAVTYGSDGSPSYEWSRLDRGIDCLVQCGLAPIFELMGNPGGCFDDFNDDRQLQRWKLLVHDLAEHLMARYGREEVESWYFESWNEPDVGWWPQWPADEGSFCNYYDACSEGLKAANPRLILGGPGTCVTLSSLFRAFLTHCDHGQNYFTGEKGVRLDFISIHEKGAPANPEDLNPHTLALLSREVRIIDHICQHHPRLAGLPFMNNECDPQVGWKHIHTWHARPYYAALACKVIDQHLRRLVDGLGCQYILLSNDNGFIGTWGNRTLLARCGDPQWIEDGQNGHAFLEAWKQRDFATPPFALIKKPILNAMTLLSYLGEQRLACRGLPEDNLGAIATCTPAGEVAVLIYHSRDQIISCGSEPVTLHLENLPFKHAMLVHYRIDERRSDPYPWWEDAGAPEYPAPDLLAELRAHQEPALLAEPVDVIPTMGILEMSFDLPLPSVSLVLLLPRPQDPPAAVTGLRVDSFQGLHGPEYLLRWDALPERSIRTYQVLRAASADGPYGPVENPDLVCSAYLYVPASQEGAIYIKVAATDYWGRAGIPSNFIVIS